MPHTCVVRGCSNRAKPGPNKTQFYCIPKIITSQGEQTLRLSTERRHRWLAMINRKGFKPEPEKRHFKVCSDHFITGKRADLYDVTNPDWAPSLRMGPEPPKRNAVDPESVMKRYQRAKGRRNKVKAAEALLDLHNASRPMGGAANVDKHSAVSDERPGGSDAIDERPGGSDAIDERPGGSDAIDERPGGSDAIVDAKNDQQDAGGEASAVSDARLVEMMRAELQRLISENMKLKDQLRETRMTPESLKDDDEVRHLTGLDHQTLMAVFGLVQDALPGTAARHLTTFEKLMVVLMKLRLNLSLHDLACRFSVSKSCVSNVFLDVIHVLFVKLKGLISCPETDDLRTSKPGELGPDVGLNVSVIIDCFEMLIERPSNVLARAETLNADHQNTVKFLIGITPQGAVAFLSQGWGGRTPDQHLTENCGLLDKLSPGDLVLANPGSTFQAGVGMSCAEVTTPDVATGRGRFSPVELEPTQKLARTKMNVERVIRLVRNQFPILQSTLPMDYLRCRQDRVPTVDQIVTVSCALLNLCPSVLT